MKQEKYIDLLLNGCLKLKKDSALLIYYNSVIDEFVDKVVKKVKDLGIEDIYLDRTDSKKVHEVLKNINEKDIEKHELFDKSVWDEYAKKNASFLMLCTEIPHLMDDIDSAILAKVAVVQSNSRPLYKEKQLKSEIPWTIAAVPNEIWAKEIFQNSSDALKEFWDKLFEICMVDENDPIKNWEAFLKKQQKVIKKLNAMQIKKLYFKNKLGTDLELELHEKARWECIGGDKWISNMPSYEIFTTPNLRKTNGVVYSSKPLIYNGKIIDEFKVTFKDGKVESFEAKKGEDILKEIINSDETSGYLGEVALVNYNSPISNLNINFNTTLIDENASCHLALGSGFSDCIENGNELSKEELKELGVNNSKIHVDFMIGTKDLLVEAETKDGLVVIMKDGNICI